MGCYFSYHIKMSHDVTPQNQPEDASSIWIVLVLGHDQEKAMATHSSTLVWKVPWTEEPGRLQSMGSLSRAQLSDFTFTFHFHALEKEMATHSSIVAWRIPGTEEPSGLPSMGSHRVGHDWSDIAAAAAAAAVFQRIWSLINRQGELILC